MRQGPPQNAVRAEIERITASRYFAGAERLSRFLRYIVQEEMEGRGGQIKEYAVAVEVYGRKPDYDPKSDAIVRVEAGRLRIKLEQYYTHEGRDDAVHIEVPRRSYAPVLSWQSKPEAPHQLPRRWLYITAAILVVTSSWLYWRSWRAGSNVRFFSLAVLPLVNLSAGDEMARFSESLTEEITNRLAATEGLRVAARTSASQYQGKPRDVSSIGRALNVGAVLEGSVQRSGSQVRLTAQLVATADGYHLWSEEYQKDEAHLLDFERLAASTIARTLGGRFAGLTPVEARQTTRSQKALNWYLRGHEVWLTQKRPGLLQSVDYYQKALAEDPSYADAYAGLAASALYLDSLDPQPNQWIARARDAATRALALNDRLADVHARLGNIYLYTDWDFAAA
jgi:serine/threonine-protein kinase